VIFAGKEIDDDAARPTAKARLEVVRTTAAATSLRPETDRPPRHHGRLSLNLTSMSQFSPLEWDSSLFGFPVAEIIGPYVATEELREILAELENQGFRLAYWRAASQVDADVGKAVERLGGACVDRKTTFVLDLRTSPPAEDNSIHPCRALRRGDSFTVASPPRDPERQVLPLRGRCPHSVAEVRGVVHPLDHGIGQEAACGRGSGGA
jgi:hypothetical protein